MRYLIPLLFIFITGCGLPRDFGNTPEHTNEAALNAFVEATYKEGGLPGTTIIAFDENDLLYQKSMGYADLETQRSFDEHTVMNIASISKTFIAVALMKAIDQGKISIEDKINDYLPFPVVNPNFPDTPILVRHLVTHTSSIQDFDAYSHAYYFPNAANLTKEDIPKDFRRYFKMLIGNKPLDESELLKAALTPNGHFYSSDAFSSENAPGQNFNYSNLAATLAGLVIEQAVGMRYEDYTRKEIFEPLGMNETWWDNTKVPTGRMATRYYNRAATIPDYHLITRADGGVITTVSDLRLFAIEMIRGHEGNSPLLSEASFKTMFSEQFNQDGQSIGIIWELGASGGFRHDGGDPGVTTNLSYNATRKRAMIMFTNVEATKKSYVAMTRIWNAVGRYDFKPEKSRK